MSLSKIIKTEEKVICNEHFYDERLSGVSLKEVIFKNCYFNDITFECVHMRTVKFVNCRFYGCDFKMCKLSTVFEDCILTSRFSMCDLSKTIFVKCRLKEGFFYTVCFELTSFVDTVFDGMRAFKNLNISPVLFTRCSYTMGGATREECERA